MSAYLSRLSRTATAGLMGVALLGAVLLLPGSVGTAEAGVDDFEFGQALAAKGKKLGQKYLFRYARSVYEGILSDGQSSEEAKELAKFGLAELNSQEALGALGRESVTYDELVSLFDNACTALEDFAKRNPDHPKANKAKLGVGTTRLGFVQYARDTLLGDSELMKARNASAGKVQRDAKAFVQTASNHFEKLRAGHDDPEASELSQLAQYYWVLTQHYIALVQNPCSKTAEAAFKKAGEELDLFITINDGTLVAVYAQDILGLNFVELAKCATDEEQQSNWYRQALSWFETCMETPNEGPSFLEVITRGFYHFARTCLAAGRLGGTNYLRVGAERVAPMLERYPDAWRQDNGIRALIELGRIQRERERMSDSVSVLQLAAEKAKAGGKIYLENLANLELSRTISQGGGEIRVDADVIMRVANARYAEKRYGEAIAMFQQAIKNTDRTTENLRSLVSAWQRVSASYAKMGDDLGAVVALEPIHELWLDGLAPPSSTTPDPYLLELGNIRWGAVGRMRALADATESSAYEKRFREMRDDFLASYPNHPIGAASVWNAAVEAFQTAGKQKRANDSKWRKTLAEAVKGLEQVSKDEKSQNQDKAFVYLARAAYRQEDWAGIVKMDQAAKAWWETEKAKQMAQQFPTIRSRRRDAAGALGYWVSEGLLRQERWDALVERLDGFHVDFASWKEASEGTPQHLYFTGTLGNLVLAHLGKGDIETTNRIYRQLLRDAPGYRRLPNITQELASYYNEKAKGIEARLRELIKELADLRPEMRRLESTANNTADALNGQRKGLARNQDIITLYEDAKAKGDDPFASVKISDTMYETAKEQVPVVTAQINELQTTLNTLSTDLESKQQRSQVILDELETLRDQLYGPRVKAASYYYDLWNALKLAGSPADADNVKVFADLYRRAATLRPQVKENWDRAKELFEDFLGRSGISSDDKQEAIGHLGSIYYRLARTAQDEAQRAEAVQQARDRLQSSMAPIEANNPLLVAHLKGEQVAFDWPHPVDGRRYWFVFERPRDVAHFKQMVQNMGAPGGLPVVTFEKEGENRRQRDALNLFQQNVRSNYKEAQLKRLANSLRDDAGFDVRFFVRFGNRSKEFRQALAWVYSESGELEDMQKSASLARSLTDSTKWGYDEDSEGWWQAMITRLTALTTRAELLMKAEGPSASTKDAVDRVSKRLVSVVNGFPTLGKESRPESLEELQALGDRVTTLRNAAGERLLNLDIRRREIKRFGMDEAASAGTPEDGTPEDGTPEDGTPEDGGAGTEGGAE